MGLRDDVQADIAEAFDDDLADAVTNFAASRTVIGDTLDPVTGTYTKTTTAYDGRGVFGAYAAHEIDGQHIQRADVKLTALQNEVTDTPAIDDIIDGYAVINVAHDPAGAAWSLQLRRA